MAAKWVTIGFRQGFAESLVLSKKTNKTLICAVWRKVLNKKYKVWKRIKTTLMVHDELNECVPGDRVLIKQCRPMSKRKRHMVFDIIHKYKPADFLRKFPEYAETQKKGAQVIPEALTRKARRLMAQHQAKQEFKQLQKEADEAAAAVEAQTQAEGAVRQS
jgi:small subunit ribosomal protein S17